MANFESAKERNEAHDMCADDGNQRDGFSFRQEWMVLSISSVIIESLEDKSPEVNDEEYMQAVVTNDQERENV